MINAKIDETTLLNLFMDRLEHWTTDKDILALYERYLEDLIDCGIFEDAEININLIIDNLYINDTIIMSKEDFEKYIVDLNGYDKVLAKDEDKDLYLVSSY